MPAEIPALRSVKLAGKWMQVARGHVALSGLSCTCGIGFVAIGVADFEQHLLDYVHARHRSDPQIDALFRAAGYAEAASVSLTQLLRALTAASLTPEAADRLLTDLERAIDSFETVHARQK